VPVAFSAEVPPDTKTGQLKTFPLRHVDLAAMLLAKLRRCYRARLAPYALPIPHPAQLASPRPREVRPAADLVHDLLHGLPPPARLIGSAE
jgi:hypothetical protein